MPMSADSNAPFTPLPAPTAIERSALDWFARCDRGLDAAEEAEFERWLSADPQHTQVFNELAGTWELLREAQPARGEAGAPASVRARPAGPGRWLSWALPLAAAAALVMGYVGYWRPVHFTADAATRVGDLRTMRLPDGSIVKLNTDSELAVNFTPGERRLQLLRGEASFAVAKNARRPFVVEASGVAVRAVGTAFNVRLENQAVEVLVLEGRVQVNDAVSGASLLSPHGGVGAHPVLGMGQRALVPVPAPIPVRLAPEPAVVSSLSSDELQRRNAWQDRRLEFEAAPLHEIVAEFNRFSTHQLLIADPALGEQRFGGSFNANDAAGLVRMLRENFGVTVEEGENVTVLRAAK